MNSNPFFIFTTPDKPLEGTSQGFVPIVDIVDDIVLHKDGSGAVILESTSLNFGLLSEREQQAVIAAYAALVNSFTFAVQITVRSQKKDISSYLDYLDHSYEKIENDKLKGLMRSYRSFVEETIKKKNVLSKKFYITIPFSSLELGVSKTFSSFATRSTVQPFPKSYVLKKIKTVLLPKRDHIIRQSGRLGLQLKQLKTPQLITLFYDIFNPQMAAKGIRITSDNLENQKT